ncbi:hypothetical protein [Carnobacterium sp. TMP28]|uniref:hypothetical protein n=1 Tax=Carnobacterium sp. TMP28 TaxID=3397060 RepID=UPI0039E0FA10
MSKQIPKAIKVEMVASILKIEFDNAKVKFLRSHYNKDIVDSFSLKKGKKKRFNLLLAANNSWLGSETAIESNGTVILNGKDSYTREELWNESKVHIAYLAE